MCPATPVTGVTCPAIQTPTMQHYLDSLAFADDTPHFVPRIRGRRKSQKKKLDEGNPYQPQSVMREYVYVQSLTLYVGMYMYIYLSVRTHMHTKTNVN